MGLKLPYCHLVCNILDYLGMAPAKLLTKAWRIMLSCCIVWRQDLEVVIEENLELTVHEFFNIHGIRLHDGKQCSFHLWMGYRVVHLESRYSHIKKWDRNFFFISRVARSLPFIRPANASFLWRPLSVLILTVVISKLFPLGEKCNVWILFTHVLGKTQTLLVMMWSLLGRISTIS